jgi:hypothetical protein
MIRWRKHLNICQHIMTSQRERLGSRLSVVLTTVRASICEEGCKIALKTALSVLSHSSLILTTQVSYPRHVLLPTDV